MARLLGCRYGGDAGGPSCAGGGAPLRPPALPDSSRIALVGEGSVAASPSCSVAAPRGLVLEAPFLSVPDAAASFFTRLPGPLFRGLRAFLHASIQAHRLPSRDRIAGVAQCMPVVVLHGLHDGIVPHEQGRELAALAGAPLHSFERGHEDVAADPKLVGVLEGIFREWETPSKAPGVPLPEALLDRDSGAGAGIAPVAAH
uniref:Serine aminopeptidase S33 domain-containing protein n=1 Tax=Pyrodinium bahamense TaxID=73915 RepID=A0A7S0FUD0_9DINO